MLRSREDFRGPFRQARTQLIMRRLALGLTQRDLGAITGSRQGVISAIESGMREEALLSSLERLARGLGGRLVVTFVADEAAPAPQRPEDPQVCAVVECGHPRLWHRDGRCAGDLMSCACTEWKGRE